MNKFETWIVGIVAVTITTLLATTGGLLMRLL
jgi:hypothetical protein